jgi:predicted nucleic acid-binding protein
MPSAKPRLYWDSDVFLAYINAEADRVDIVEELLTRSKCGHLTVLTSTIAIVEVAFSAAEKAGGTLDPATEAKIAALWEDRDAVTLVEVSELVNRRAVALIRDGLPRGWRLRPMDALHLASAALFSVDEMYTYNLSDFKRYEAIVNCKIDAPYLVQGMLGLPPPTP